MAYSWSNVERHVRKLMSDRITYYRVKNSRDGLRFVYDNKLVFVYYDEARFRFRCHYYPADKWEDYDRSKIVEVF